MKHFLKKLYVLILFILSLCIFTACNKTEEKVVVNFLYAKQFNNLKKLVEEKYDNIELSFEHTAYSSEYIRRLQKGHGPDIVIFNQNDKESSREYLLDISDEASSLAYDGTVMRQIQNDGKIYLLPLPEAYFGYIINETLYQENSIPIPTDNETLISSLIQLKTLSVGVGDDGINMAIEANYNSGLGNYLIGSMVPDFLAKEAGVKWLADYRNNLATFAGTWDNALDLLNRLKEKQLIDIDTITGAKKTISYKERMANASLACVAAESLLYQEIIDLNYELYENGDEPLYTYRMLPFFSDEENHSWAAITPIGYIGINKNISKEKQEACKKVLNVLSTEEGQKAIISDLGGGASSLKDNSSVHNRLVDENIPYGLTECINDGYAYNIFFPNNIVEYLGNQIKSVLKNKITLADALVNIDSYSQNGSSTSDDLSVIGIIAEDHIFQNYNVRLEETKIGNLVADSILEVTQADIAVVNGGGIRGSLYKGEIYQSDLETVCPYDNKIVVLSLDGKTIIEMLENSLSEYTNEFPSGRFLQISGMNYVFDSSKEQSKRIIKVTLKDGSLIDLTKTYTVAVNDYMAGIKGYAEGNGDGYTMLNVFDNATLQNANVKLVEYTTLTYRDALRAYFDAHRDDLINAMIEGRIIDISKKASE